MWRDCAASPLSLLVHSPHDITPRAQLSWYTGGKAAEFGLRRRGLGGTVLLVLVIISLTLGCGCDFSIHVELTSLFTSPHPNSQPLAKALRSFSQASPAEVRLSFSQTQTQTRARDRTCSFLPKEKHAGPQKGLVLATESETSNPPF